MDRQVSTKSQTQENGLTPVRLEIERKWLVNAEKLPDLSALEPRQLLQGYLAIEPGGNEVRIRQDGEDFYLTVKGPGNLVRSEPEVSLEPQQFLELWPGTDGRRIEKARINIALCESVTAELDIYHGSLTGLLTVEVEFPTVRDSESFSAPGWFGKEVTENSDYKNRNLAVKGLPVDT